MALNPADIAVVSELLDQALALPVEEREAWLAALPEEHVRHRNTLRDMLVKSAELDTNRGLTLPLYDVVHSHSVTRHSWAGPRTSFLRTSSG
jgi:hypothetical protein